jgi:hypothetical protein
MNLSRLLRGEETPIVRTNFFYANETCVTPYKTLKDKTESSAGRFSFARMRSNTMLDI